MQKLGWTFLAVASVLLLLGLLAFCKHLDTPLPREALSPNWNADAQPEPYDRLARVVWFFIAGAVTLVVSFFLLTRGNGSKPTCE